MKDQPQDGQDVGELYLEYQRWNGYLHNPSPRGLAVTPEEVAEKKARWQEARAARARGARPAPPAQRDGHRPAAITAQESVRRMGMPALPATGHPAGPFVRGRADGPPAPRLWKAGSVWRTAEGLEPRLASWNASTHPDQARLRAYLDGLEAALGDLSAGPGRLFLHLDVDVREPGRLLLHHDLENYLTPVVHRLGHARFVLVSARKRVGGGSRVVVGEAEPVAQVPEGDTWGHFAHHAGSGAQERSWKAGLREALRAARPRPLPPGQVEVQLAWRCAPTRNWAALWKPTGDAMGPVLGEPDARHPFNPQDDRIVALWLHRHADAAMGHDVGVAMWWRAAAPPGAVLPGPGPRSTVPPEGSTWRD
jgi:hypothetical protein